MSGKMIWPSASTLADVSAIVRHFEANPSADLIQALSQHVETIKHDRDEADRARNERYTERGLLAMRVGKLKAVLQAVRDHKQIVATSPEASEILYRVERALDEQDASDDVVQLELRASLNERIKLNAELQRAHALVGEACEALQWCSGADCFQKGGIAEKGWANLRPLMVKLAAFVANSVIAQRASVFAAAGYEAEPVKMDPYIEGALEGLKERIDELTAEAERTEVRLDRLERDKRQPAEASTRVHAFVAGYGDCRVREVVEELTSLLRRPSPSTRSINPDKGYRR